MNIIRIPRAIVGTTVPPTIYLTMLDQSGAVLAEMPAVLIRKTWKYLYYSTT